MVSVRKPFWRHRALIALLFTALVAGGCGSEEELLEWSVFKQTGPRKVKLAGVVDYCANVPKPHVQQVNARYWGSRLFLRLELSPLESPTRCAFQAVGVYKTVTLRRDLDELELFDSSASPPERRWPDD